MIFSDPMLDELCVVAVSMMHQFDSQNLSNSFWALACLVLEDIPLVAALSERSIALMPEFVMQEVANIS